ncbi:MAG TPA: hypothetical protein VNO17_11585 [Actinomycetota bacterium]|nr:hypothetical protein [Actinomycetota bacterium]
MRRTIAGLVMVVAAANCRDVAATGPPGAPGLRVHPSPSPYSVVEAGGVRALVPDAWQPLPLEDGGPHRGLYASPRPAAWDRMDGTVAGMAALWVDATDVGVPSDYYYLAATGPALQRLTGSPDCRSEVERVFADHRPSLLAGAPASPGDYVARGEGVCATRGTLTRWAYFVAAPGFGPVRRLGIPGSGLYVVVAVVPDSRRAEVVLDRLVDAAEFGGTPISQMIAAARGRTG